MLSTAAPPAAAAAPSASGRCPARGTDVCRDGTEELAGFHVTVCVTWGCDTCVGSGRGGTAGG